MSIKIAEKKMSGTPELLNKKKAELKATTLQAVVKGKKVPGETWKEVCDIASVSSTGAGFYIRRECQIGTLVSVMAPIAPHLRCYDHDKEIYRVFGLVQHCQQLPGKKASEYHVGVAFIGKHEPESYKENPQQNYKICGTNEFGLWKVKESRSPFTVRRHLRYWTSIDLYLAVVDAQKDTSAGEKTTTENISKSGAALFSTVDVNVGDRVKFICEKYDFSGLAVVCNRQTGDDGRQRLHIQFVECSFPVEKLDPSKMKKDR